MTPVLGVPSPARTALGTYNGVDVQCLRYRLCFVLGSLESISEMDGDLHVSVSGELLGTTSMAGEKSRLGLLQLWS